MQERGLSFGGAAADYERYRPDYPSAVVERIVDYAGRPVRTALEIGAGTGKATRAMLAHGIAVTATDPDAGMLAVLRERAPTAQVIQSRLEELPAWLSGFDVVYAAASLHWTRPDGRWQRIAALLTDGGTVASFGGQYHLADPEIEERARAARRGVVDEEQLQPPDGVEDSGPMRWPGSELEASDLFTDVRQLTIPRRLRLPAAEYVGHLSTVSAYRVLDAEVRGRVLDRILHALPDEVDVDSDVTLHLARAVPADGQPSTSS